MPITIGCKRHERAHNFFFIARLWLLRLAGLSLCDYLFVTAMVFSVATLEKISDKKII